MDTKFLNGWMPEDLQKTAAVGHGAGLGSPEQIVGGSTISKSSPRQIASVAVFKDGKMLMGKRRDNDKWTMPGGHLDKDEHPHDGARRELKEEAGIDSDKLEHLGTMDLDDVKGLPLRVHSYRYDIPNDATTTMRDDPDKEVHRWHWIDTKEGLSKDVLQNLHSPKNVTLRLLGLQEWGMDKNEKIEILVKSREKLELMKSRLAKMREEVRQSLYRLHENPNWAAHVSTPGKSVKIRSLGGKIGKVIAPAKDPVNGYGPDRMVLVEHEYNGPGTKIQRHYPAHELEPHK